jgi:hypothetical protein
VAHPVTKNHRKSKKLGNCKKCVVLSSTLLVVSSTLFLVSVFVSYGAFDNPLILMLASVGVGFFGVLTSLHLIMRILHTKETKTLTGRMRFRR